MTPSFEVGDVVELRLIGEWFCMATVLQPATPWDSRAEVRYIRFLGMFTLWNDNLGKIVRWPECDMRLSLASIACEE